MGHTSRLALFIANAQAIRKELIWQNALTKRLVALLYAQDDKCSVGSSIVMIHHRS